MRFRFFFVIIFCVFFLCACSRSESDRIYIGAIFSLTGDDSFCGCETRNGIELALSKRPMILDKKVELKIINSESDHLRNIDAYNRLSADKNICAIISGQNSILSEDVAAVSQKNPLPIIIPSASLKSITEYGENIYRCAFTNEMQGECIANFALDDLKAKTAAVFYDMDNQYSVTLARAFSKTFRQRGKILVEQMHPTEDNGYKVQLSKIKLKNPDVLFVPDYAYNSVLVKKQADDMGIESIFLGGDTWEEVLGSLGSLEEEKDTFENTYFCTHYSSTNPDDKIKSFVDDYKNMFDKEPSSFAALGFDAVNILLDAIQSAKSTDRDMILKSLSQTNYSGITGNIKFNPQRNPIKDLTIMKVQDDENIFLKTLKIEDKENKEVFK